MSGKQPDSRPADAAVMATRFCGREAITTDGDCGAIWDDRRWQSTARSCYRSASRPSQQGSKRERLPGDTSSAPERVDAAGVSLQHGAFAWTPEEMSEADQCRL
jgi:hypothetical protein